MSTVLPSVDEKPRFVAEMFARIAGRYDLMNTLMTLGQDARWRRLVAESLPGNASAVLDVGSGTGRLAQAVVQRDSRARVVASDFTFEMLRIAPAELRRVAADALTLPFPDAAFDAVISGFVVRNVANLEAGLDEQIRVLRPGGTLAILETTPGPRNAALRRLYKLYFRYLVPRIGVLIAGDASAYTYLPESTLAFLEPARLVASLGARGLRDVRTLPLMLGCVAITAGRKPD